MRKSPATRTVWARAKEALKAAGRPATQTAIAKLLKIEQPSVSDWNRPGNYPSMEHGIALAREAKVCVQWLYEEDGPKHIGPPDDDIAYKLWEIWPGLSEEVRIYILGYASKHRKPGEGPAPTEAPPKQPRPLADPQALHREKRRADDSQKPAY